MIHREISRIGVELSLLGLGGHEFLPNSQSRGFNEDWRKALTPNYIFPDFGGRKRRAVMAMAYEAGINFYDATQDSEKEALGRLLKEMPPPFEVYVQTRPEDMMYDRDPGNVRMADYAQLKPEVERILKLMGRGQLDFLNLGITPEAFRNDPEYLARLKSATDRLKEDGLIRFTSADTFQGEETYLAQIASGAFDTLFINLNFADSAGLARVLPAAQQAGMGVNGREAYLKGALFKMGAEAGIAGNEALARAALRWTLSLPELTSMMVGVDTTAHLETALAVLEAPALTDEDQALLERVKATAAFQDYAAGKAREFGGVG